MGDRALRSGKNLVFYIDYSDDDPDVSPGLLPLIHILRRKGHEVTFVTAEKELFNEVCSKKFDVACLSTYSSNLPETLNLAAEIKKINSKITTILGGCGTRRIADKLIQHYAVDLVIEGEADIILPEILELIETESTLTASSEPQSSDPGPLFNLITDESALKIANRRFRRRVLKDGLEFELYVPITNLKLKTCQGKIISRDDVDEYPINHWLDDYLLNKKAFELSGKQFPFTLEDFVGNCHSYPSEAEINQSSGICWDIVKVKNWSSLGLYGQRGCPWARCSFCCIKYPSNRRLSVNQTILLLKEAVQNNLRTVIFTDDVFIQSRKRTIDLCQRIRDEGLSEHLQFLAQTSVGTTDKQVLTSMEKANFTQLMVGVETFLPEKAVYLGKTIDGPSYVRRASQMIDDALDAGLQLNLFIILCTPRTSFNEASSEILEISRMLKKNYELYSKIPLCSFLTQVKPLIGSELITREEYTCTSISLPKQVNGQVESFEYPKMFLMEKDLVDFIDLMEKQIRSPRERGYLSTLTYAADTIKQIIPRTDEKSRDEIEERCDEVLENINSIRTMKIGELIICYK